MCGGGRASQYMGGRVPCSSLSLLPPESMGIGVFGSGGGEKHARTKTSISSSMPMPVSSRTMAVSCSLDMRKIYSPFSFCQ